MKAAAQVGLPSLVLWNQMWGWEKDKDKYKDGVQENTRTVPREIALLVWLYHEEGTAGYCTTKKLQNIICLRYDKVLLREESWPTSLLGPALSLLSSEKANQMDSSLPNPSRSKDIRLLWPIHEEMWRWLLETFALIHSLRKSKYPNMCCSTMSQRKNSCVFQGGLTEEKHGPISLYSAVCMNG